jgi:hypothetical protein
MPEDKTPESSQPGTTPAPRSASVVRKLLGARRLLVATIGAATVQFAAGCANSSVANLMAAPGRPESGSGGSGYLVANLVTPPFLPQSGTGGAGAPGQGGTGGQRGAAGADPDDTDAGIDDDAGQA